MRSKKQWFNFEEIEEKRASDPKKWSWRKLGNLYGKHHEAVRKRFKGEQDRRILVRESESSLITVKKPQLLPQMLDEPHTEEKEFKIYERIPTTYGQLPFTQFKSDLSPEDWSREFVFPLLSNEIWNKIEYITEIFDLIVEALEEKLKRLLLEPRKHGKTFTLIAIFCWWVIDQKKSLLVITSDSSAKNRIYAAVHSVIKSDLVRSYYGDIVLRTNSQMGELWFHDKLRSGIDPSLRVAGMEATVIGAHADWMHLEDPIEAEAISDDTNERLVERFDAVLEPITDRITISGTRKGVLDWFHKMIRRGFKPIHRRALEKISGRWPTLEDCVIEIEEYDGQEYEFITSIKKTGAFKMLGCPDFTLDQLLEKRIRNLESFQSQYQNEPIPPSGLYFAKADWVVVDRFERNHAGIKYFIAIDPAYSTTSQTRHSRTDNTAIIVCAIQDRKLFIVDGIMERLPFDKIMDEILAFNDEYQPLSIYVENNFYQVWLEQHAVKMGLYHMEPVPTKEVGGKLVRIDALKMPFKRRVIRILKTCKIERKLYMEYMHYNQKPSTSSRQDDGLDALSILYSKVSRYLLQFGESSNHRKIKTGTFSNRG